MPGRKRKKTDVVILLRTDPDFDNEEEIGDGCENEERTKGLAMTQNRKRFTQEKKKHFKSFVSPTVK
jgi:hypothetical protein